jgi:lysophospholipase L1-like esterase
MRALRIVLAVAVLVLAGGAQAQPREPLRILFVGNSLTATNDLPALVATLARTTRSRPVEYRTIAPGGVNLEDHWNAGDLPAALATGRWDAVVLQQGPSALLESRDHLKEWATRIATAAREHGTTPALLTVWPESYRRNVLPAVISSYRNAARAAGAKLLPAGGAWQAAWRRNARLPLYGSDGFHPSTLGTYLTAIVVLAGLTGDEPNTRPFRIDRPGFRLRVTAARAKLLHAAAREALRAA